MQINIKATGIDLTSAIEEYVRKRLEGLKKLLADENMSPLFDVEVGKTTEHHKKGEYFCAETNVRSAKGNFRAVAEEADLYAAIDEMKEDLERQLVEKKDRGQTLLRRGARSIKKMLKGLSKRNPFTSKYD